jgi:Rrf2 family nitric oxide-sensitive transcriptional repressor
MKLTSHTDFGMRVLMSLAAVQERLVTVEELANRHHVSKHHLMKVAQTLIHAGWVEGVRGRRGGLRLAVDPGRIGIGDVVRCLEGDFAVVPCLGDGGASCILTGACKLTGLLGRAVKAFVGELDGVTLADLATSTHRGRLGPA